MNVFLIGFHTNSCPYIRNFRVTTDRHSNWLGKFDAIIFNMAVIHQTDKLPPTNTRESPKKTSFLTKNHHSIIRKTSKRIASNILAGPWVISRIQHSLSVWPDRIKPWLYQQVVISKSHTRKNKTKTRCLVCFTLQHNSKSTRKIWQRIAKVHLYHNLWSLRFKMEKKVSKGFEEMFCHFKKWQHWPKVPTFTLWFSGA